MKLISIEGLSYPILSYRLSNQFLLYLPEESRRLVIVRYTTFKDFYPFYLQEHSNGANRTLHFIGTTLVILIALWIILTGSWKFVWVVPACGYGFSWSGHFFFQKNNPAAFKQPFYSLLGDFTMWWEIVTQTIPMYPHELVT